MGGRFHYYYVLVTVFLKGPSVFYRLKRGPDGKFNNGDLANVLQVMSATESIVGQWRANGTPPALRIIEIAGIEQSRMWGVCTMNEFRQFMNLKQFESFDEWNPDPSIARTAEHLYVEFKAFLFIPKRFVYAKLFQSYFGI